MTSFRSTCLNSEFVAAEGAVFAGSSRDDRLEKIYQQYVVWCRANRACVGNVNTQGLLWAMGVSKNSGTPKWMGYHGKPY